MGIYDITVDLGTVEFEDPETKEKRILAPELEGVKVTFRNPKLLPYGKSKAADKAAREADGNRDILVGISEDLVRDLVVAWDLTDFDTGEALPVPKDDGTTIERAPTLALTAVMVAIKNAGAAPAVPKAT